VTEPSPSQAISPLRYVVGSTALFGYHLVCGAALEGLALVQPRLRPVARFHRAYLVDLFRDVLAREGVEVRCRRNHER
jgi:hypothetical protein